MKSFVVDKIKGAVLICLFGFVLTSFLTFNAEDPGINIAGNLVVPSNIMGFVGAYLSSYLFTFFGVSAYLFPLFFLIHGLKLLFIKNNNAVLLNFFILFTGIILTNYTCSLIYSDFSLIGNFLRDISLSFVESYLDSKFIFYLFVFLLISSSLIIICFSLSFQRKYLFMIVGKFILLIVILFNAIIKKPFTKNNIKNQKSTQIRKTKNKLEPTLLRSQRKKTTLFKEKNLQQDLSSSKYLLPSVNLLKKSIQKKISIKEIEKQNIELSKKLELTLAEYGVEGKVVSFKSGPVVTLFEFIPAAGVKTSKVVGLSDDITRAMSSLSTRISPQPGKTSVGIEIPNSKREGVLLGDLIDDEDFLNESDGLILALGKNISGEKKYTDLEKMPHLLIAGTTGSGKSVGINSMIVSLLFKFKPSECKLILIDPKMLELSIYEDIPHLLTPVVTNPNKAVFALKWVVREMENRYRLMSSLNVKNIKSFNSKIINATSSGRKLYREAQTGIDKETRRPIIEKVEIPLEKIPLIVVVIDEMADLMMVAGKEVENLVQRLAQMARASGIHIIAATQRPSVDVITGTIKANFPSRISFRVASRFDSRTILNEMGAEQLLGSGDMLFIENGSNLNRVHGGFVSESEIESVVNFIKSQKIAEVREDITIENEAVNDGMGVLNFENKNVDELYEKAVNIVLDQQKVSTSFIQRYLQIGYNRAARIVEKMEEEDIISEPSNSGKRNVLKKK